MPSKRSVDRSSQRGLHQVNMSEKTKPYQLKSKNSNRKFGAALRRSKMAPQRTACSGGGRGPPSVCMTPEELCRYDDICTALIIDPYMGFQTHKMNIRFRPLSNQSELKKIVDDFIEDQDYDKAHDTLLCCDQRRMAPLIRTEQEQNLMHQHIFCFLKMFDKDAGFRIKPCQRYSAEENQGGKIVATKSWKKNEYISMLVGCIGELTPQQEKDLLVCGQNDFSVMWSNRKKKSQLWLGPAAYMNHDCKPNCRFIPVGNTAYLQVIRDIVPGDEILLSYGDNFFGPDNCSCECNTCEMIKRGAFKPKEDEIVEENGIRLRQIPSRMSTRAERTSARIGLKDNWNGRAQRLKDHAELLNVGELKKRKLTKYDAKIILEGNNLLPESFHPPSVHIEKELSHTSSDKEVLNTDGGKVAQDSDICTNTPSQDSSTSLVALADQHGGETACTPANPCVSRRRGKRSQMHFSMANLKHSVKKLVVGGQEQTEKKMWSEDTEMAPPLLVAKPCQDQDLDMAAGIAPVQTVFLSPTRNSVHCDVYSSCSPHANGRLPLKNKTLNKEPVRQSPRLRPQRCSGQHDKDGVYMCSTVTDQSFANEAEAFVVHHSPMAINLDNDDSGLGEMTGDVCDKSLDSNHNFHEPPVLEPQVPYLPPNPPCSLTPVPHGDGDSDQELNKSSNSVPSLSFCGPVALSDSSRGALPAVIPQGKTRKRKRKEPITLCIKLEHPDNDKKVDFYQRLERDGKSRFVKIEPKETHSVKQSTCSGVSVKLEQREVDLVRPSQEVGEAHRSVAGPSKLVVARPSLQAAGSSQRCTPQPVLPPVKLKLRRDMWQSVA